MGSTFSSRAKRVFTSFIEAAKEQKELETTLSKLEQALKAAETALEQFADKTLEITSFDQEQEEISILYDVEKAKKDLAEAKEQLKKLADTLDISTLLGDYGDWSYFDMWVSLLNPKTLAEQKKLIDDLIPILESMPEAEAKATLNLIKSLIADLEHRHSDAMNALKEAESCAINHRLLTLLCEFSRMQMCFRSTSNPALEQEKIIAGGVRRFLELRNKFIKFREVAGVIEKHQLPGLALCQTRIEREFIDIILERFCVKRQSDASLSGCDENIFPLLLQLLNSEEHNHKPLTHENPSHADYPIIATLAKIEILCALLNSETPLGFAFEKSNQYTSLLERVRNALVECFEAPHFDDRPTVVAYLGHCLIKVNPLGRTFTSGGQALEDRARRQLFLLDLKFTDAPDGILSAEDYYGKARMFEVNNNLTIAIEFYSKAIAKDPKYTPAFNKIVKLRIKDILSKQDPRSPEDFVHLITVLKDWSLDERSQQSLNYIIKPIKKAIEFLDKFAPFSAEMKQQIITINPCALVRAISHQLASNGGDRFTQLALVHSALFCTNQEAPFFHTLFSSMTDITLKNIVFDRLVSLDQEVRHFDKQFPDKMPRRKPYVQAFFGSPHAMLQQGLRFIDKADYRGALSSLNEAIETLPAPIPAEAYAARSVCAQKKSQSSMKDYEKALGYTPTNPDTLTYLARYVDDAFKMHPSFDTENRAIVERIKWLAMFTNAFNEATKSGKQQLWLTDKLVDNLHKFLSCLQVIDTTPVQVSALRRGNLLRAIMAVPDEVKRRGILEICLTKNGLLRKRLSQDENGKPDDQYIKKIEALLTAEPSSPDIYVACAKNAAHWSARLNDALRNYLHAFKADPKNKAISDGLYKTLKLIEDDRTYSFSLERINWLATFTNQFTEEAIKSDAHPPLLTPDLILYFLTFMQKLADENRDAGLDLSAIRRGNLLRTILALPEPTKIHWLKKCLEEKTLLGKRIAENKDGKPDDTFIKKIKVLLTPPAPAHNPSSSFSLFGVSGQNAAASSNKSDLGYTRR